MRATADPVPDPPAPAPAIGRAAQRRRGLGFLIAFDVLVVALFAVLLTLSHDRTNELARTRLLNDSLLVAEWIRGTFAVSDTALRDLVAEIGVPPGDGPSGAAGRADLPSALDSVPNTVLVGIYGRDCGAIWLGATGFDGTAAAACAALRDPTGPVSVVTTLADGTTAPDRLGVLQARRLADTSGAFAGFVAVEVDVGSFAAPLERLQIGPDDSVTVVDVAAHLIARRPPAPTQLGTVIESAPLQTFLARGVETRTTRVVSPVDGVERLFVHRRVEGLPFVVVRGAAVRSYLAGWRAELLGGGLAVLALLVLSGWVWRMHARALRQQDVLERLAHTDALTGLANRRRFLAWAALELERARRHERPLALLLLDLDGLKAINDGFGHASGDLALIAVARAATAVVRRIDLVARIGGDEFAIVLPETDEEEAATVAERLQQRLARDAAHDAPTTAEALSVSIGIAVRDPDAEGDLATLLHDADVALYAAKRARRARPLFDGPTAPEPGTDTPPVAPAREPE